MSVDEAYRREAQALDDEILHCIEQRNVPDFGGLALRIFAHQLRYNEPYARYCAWRGVDLNRLPASWHTIPPAPAAAYKDMALCTFDPARADLVFSTSGTTQQRSGNHYMENSQLYDAALEAGFQDAMLAGMPQPLRYVLLVPNPAERPQSSLGYMMARVAERFGSEPPVWCLRGDDVDVERFIAQLKRATDDAAPLCIAGTAFAFVHLLEMLHARGVRELPVPKGSKIMETGGFKGKTRTVRREELYAGVAAMFALDRSAIVAEYGMTELTSQYYDVTFDSVRRKRPPPWLRARAVAPDGATLPSGVVGTLVHVDLANRSSCVAVQTEDLGAVMDDGTLVLIGREQGARLRGCSLDAEHLRALQHA